MKRWINSAIIIAALVFFLWPSKHPSLPSSPTEIRLTLLEPFTDEIIVERLITDEADIQSIVRMLAKGEVCRDHECTPIGGIIISSESHESSVQLLPGHDGGKYEFRYDEKTFAVSKSLYVSTLVSLGIAREDIRLDEYLITEKIPEE